MILNADFRDVKDGLIQNINIHIHNKSYQRYSKKGSLNKGWYSRATKSDLLRLKSDLYNYYRNILHSQCQKFYWTTFISYKAHLIKNGYRTSFMVSFAGDQADKRNDLVFLSNIFIHPKHKRQLNYQKIDEDTYALNSLLQWIVNVSDITKPINICIPSSRMRNLLIDWLEKE